MGEGICWVSVVGWTFYTGGWGWLEVCFEWVGLGGHFLLVGRDEWEWVEVYFEWMGVDGCFS